MRTIIIIIIKLNGQDPFIKISSICFHSFVCHLWWLITGCCTEGWVEEEKNKEEERKIKSWKRVASSELIYAFIAILDSSIHLFFMSVHTHTNMCGVYICVEYTYVCVREYDHQVGVLCLCVFKCVSDNQWMSQLAAGNMCMEYGWKIREDQLQQGVRKNVRYCQCGQNENKSK